MNPSRLSVLCLTAVILGCGSPQPTDAERREEISRVLRSHAYLANRRNEALPTAKAPSSAAAIWDGFCSDLERMELAFCPAEFRLAFKQHIQACRDVQAALAQLSDDGVEDGSKDEKVQAAFERGAATFQEVERVAGGFGAAP